MDSSVPRKSFAAIHFPVLAATAVISVLLRRAGFLGIFFLAPLGFAALFANARTALGAAAAAFILESLFTAGRIFSAGGNPGEIFPGLLYTVFVMGIFIWIMAPSPVRVVRRLAAGAAAVTAIFLFIMFGTEDEFLSFFRPQAELLSSLYTASAGGDAVQRSFLESYLTTDRILEFLKVLVMRGGALFSSALLFFVNRKLSFFAARFAWRRSPPADGRITKEGSLAHFHAPAETIWALSFSLLGVLLCRLCAFVPGETAAWNVLVLSVLVFLAQGGGIFFWVLSRKTRSPFFRLLINFAVIAVIFSPVINVFVLGLFVLLGIAENWLPLRAEKTGISPTPGM